LLVRDDDHSRHKYCPHWRLWAFGVGIVESWQCSGGCIPLISTSNCLTRGAGAPLRRPRRGHRGPVADRRPTPPGYRHRARGDPLPPNDATEGARDTCSAHHCPHWRRLPRVVHPNFILRNLLRPFSHERCCVGPFSHERCPRNNRHSFAALRCVHGTGAWVKFQCKGDLCRHHLLHTTIATLP
jgi:hypothetical protein